MKLAKFFLCLRLIAVIVKLTREDLERTRFIAGERGIYWGR